MEWVKIAEIISSERIARGWTMRELGQKANVSKSSISRLERGYSLSMDQVMALLKALDLDVKIERSGRMRW